VTDTMVATIEGDSDVDVEEDDARGGGGNSMISIKQ
jgi:hypothetical protein